jgi:hypothetical protein
MTKQCGSLSTARACRATRRRAMSASAPLSRRDGCGRPHAPAQARGRAGDTGPPKIEAAFSDLRDDEPANPLDAILSR